MGKPLRKSSEGIAMTRWLIWGAGGFGSEVAWLVEETEGGSCVAAFIDDRPLGHLVDGHPVIALADATLLNEALYLCAVGRPETRRALTSRAEAAGLLPGIVVHPMVSRSRSVSIGDGSIICAGSRLTTNISIGRHVHINLNCTIGHNTVIEDFCTLSPGVHVSGFVHLSTGVFVGTGAVFVNGTDDRPLRVGEGATIGAGAVVAKDVPPATTVVGVPARPLR